jgi:hypothetical protein
MKKIISLIAIVLILSCEKKQVARPPDHRVGNKYKINNCCCLLEDLFFDDAYFICTDSLNRNYRIEIGENLFKKLNRCE